MEKTNNKQINRYLILAEVVVIIIKKNKAEEGVESFGVESLARVEGKFSDELPFEKRPN